MCSHARSVKCEAQEEGEGGGGGGRGKFEKKNYRLFSFLLLTEDKEHLSQ